MPMIAQEIFIANQQKLNTTTQAIQKAGANKIHVLADFDGTLTTFFANGVKSPSIVSQIRNGDYLSVDYSKKAHELFDYYAPKERDESLSFERRKAFMHEWWTRHFELIAQSGFSKAVIQRIITNSTIQFREYTKEFIDLLEINNIPLVIMSAAPGDMLIEHLKHSNLLRPNIHVIANLYEFDTAGKALKIREPIIHSLNKSDVAIHGFPAFELIRNRPNVILLGDNIGDAGMAEGFAYEHLIKIGFLNEQVEERKKEYLENFDMVLTNDTTMQPIITLLEEFMK